MDEAGVDAAAALVVFALVHANEHFHLLGEYTTEPALIAVFSFLAGWRLVWVNLDDPTRRAACPHFL